MRCPHGVLASDLLMEENFLVDLVPNDRLVVAEAGHVAADVYRRLFRRFLPVGRHALFDHAQRDEDILLLLRKITGNAYSEHIGVLTIHGADALDVLFRHTGAIPVVNMDCVVLGSVLVVAVIEKAGQLRGVSAHQQPRSLGRQSTQNGLEDSIIDTARLVDDEQHTLRMEALQGVWGVRGTGHSKPFFLCSVHVDSLLRPGDLPLQGGVAAEPLRYFCPEDVVQLVLRGSSTWDFGIWPRADEPDHGPRLHRALPDTMPGTNGSHGIFGEAVQDRLLVDIRFCSDDVLHEVHRIVDVV